jgi:hypothetical protein
MRTGWRPSLITVLFVTLLAGASGARLAAELGRPAHEISWTVLAVPTLMIQIRRNEEKETP